MSRVATGSVGTIAKAHLLRRAGNPWNSPESVVVPFFVSFMRCGFVETRSVVLSAIFAAHFSSMT